MQIYLLLQRDATYESQELVFSSPWQLSVHEALNAHKSTLHSL